MPIRKAKADCLKQRRTHQWKICRFIMLANAQSCSLIVSNNKKYEVLYFLGAPLSIEISEYIKNKTHFNSLCLVSLLESEYRFAYTLFLFIVGAFGQFISKLVFQIGKEGSLNIPVHLYFLYCFFKRNLKPFIYPKKTDITTFKQIQGSKMNVRKVV